MPRAMHLTAEQARQSLTAHVEARGVELYCRYGPLSTALELSALLQDRRHVRYPCELVFSAKPLRDGEMAFPQPCGDSPEQGFVIYVHPQLQTSGEDLAKAVMYQLVAVNYGPFASAHDAETFGAAAFGMTRDEYYAVLCRIADALPPSDSLP